MDYKQRYEQAMLRMNKWVEGSEIIDPKEVAEFVFPELKESEDERIRKALIQHIKYKVSVISGWRKEELIAWLEKQGEQKTDDKAEPKFKVGDWIINSEGMLRHIVDVDKSGYQTDNGWLIHDCYEKEFHLWTIQDAEDGDVLANDTSIIIFRKLGNDTWDDVVDYHVGYNHSLDKINIQSGKSHYGNINTVTFKPATKEQRDLLFSKMKEAGYEWDAEKKELKKIEQKPNFCHHEVDLSNCSEEYRKAYYDGWNNCNQQHAQLEAEQNHAWSEEDEEMFDAIIADIQFTQKAHNHEVNQVVYEREIDWFKSLKERYTWKPTDEQMETMKDVVRLYKSAHSDSYRYKIETLYEDLKKLKGE